MSINFADLAWAVPGGVDRTNGDRHAQVYNVKDWGAVGDGVHNDRPNIQAAMDKCFPLGEITGGDTYCFNGLYFPPGNYRCSDLSEPDLPSPYGYEGAAVLSINTDHEGRVNFVWMFGDNSATTRIFYDGPWVDSERASTILLNLDNHIERSQFEGLHLDMSTTSLSKPPPANLGPGTICMWNRGRTVVGTAQNAGHNNWFIDMKFSGATHGLALSGEAANLGSECLFLFCKFVDNYNGMVTFSSNSLGYTVIGGYCKGSLAGGLRGQQGTIASVMGMEFAGNLGHQSQYGVPGDMNLCLGDITSENGNPILIFGCTSTSLDFSYMLTAASCLMGNYHHAASPGYVAFPRGMKLMMDRNWTVNGSLPGNDQVLDALGGINIRSNRFDLVGAISTAYLPGGPFAAGMKEPSPWDINYNMIAV